MNNPNEIDHHDEQQEEILFLSDAESGLPGDEDDEPFSSIDDMSDDAESLASAGHGSDEDYNGGCFNEME
jgi:hypothetical protein